MLSTVNKIIKSQNGMSLIEILIALTLLAIAGTFVAGKVFDQLAEGQVKSTQIQIKSVMDRLNEFRRSCGFFPLSDQGIDALIQKPTGGRECKRYPPNGFIGNNKVPKDAWDNDFIYESDGKTFTITSLGADAAEGGEGADADIKSTDL